MSDLQLPWLIPMLVQLLGLAVVLSVLGFTYDASIREKKAFLSALLKNERLNWLAVGAITIALGVGFTRAIWVIKATVAAIAFAILVLTLVELKRVSTYRSMVVRQKINPRTFVLTVAQLWLGIFILLFVVWAAHLGWHAYHLYRMAASVQSDPSQLKIEDLPTIMQGISDDIGTIDSNLRPLYPIFNALQGLPKIGGNLGQIEPVLTYIDALAHAGNEMITGLEPLFLDTTGGLSLPERASQILSSGHDHFANANHLIGQAATLRDNIRLDMLPGQLQRAFALLDSRFNLLVAGSQFLQVAPTVLGSGQAQTYLVLAQNRDELRATGGFISGIGLVTLKDGQIQSFTLGDSYAVDDFTKPYPSPPEPLKQFMLADYWVARDANWSPDFTTSARQAQVLYSLSTGIETQGVIAFNQLAVRKVLESIGPVDVLGTDSPITAENVEDYMRQAWAPAPSQGLSQEWWLHRKDFMQQLGNVIIEKVLSSSDQSQLMNLARLIVDLMDKGQLLVYFNDTLPENALVDAGWDGALHPGNSDFLYLVDSNVGFNKMDSMIVRSLAYRVDLSNPADPLGEASLSYQNTASGFVPCIQEASYGNGTYQDMQQRCYWDYWRVYAPGGAQLISSNAQPVPAGELLNQEGWPGQVESLPGEASTQVFAGLQVLPLSQSSIIDLSYHLPATVLQGSGIGQQTYTLKIDIQPGLQGLPFELDIVLPPSAHVPSVSQGMQSIGADTWRWSGALEKSIEFSLSYSQSN